MKYPNENEITDPSTKLPPEVAAEVVPYVEAAQRRYRRFRQRFREQPQEVWQEEPGIVIDHAADVFRVLSVRLLEKRPATFDEFRREIGLEAGAAEMAFQFAHHLYHDVQGGRMLAVWHRQIRDRLRVLIWEAEDLWWSPDVVPNGWEKFIGKSGDSHPPEKANLPVQDPASDVDSKATGGVNYEAPSNVAPDRGIENSNTTFDSAKAVGQARRSMTDAFIKKCLLETGEIITRKMIWRTVGYKQRSEFERWQSNSPKSTKMAAQTFTRVLSMNPRNFVDLLKKRQLLP